MRTELLTDIEFSKLSVRERETYILKKTSLNDFWIIGKVRKLSNDEKNFFFVDFHLNPYNGNRFENEIFNRPLKNTRTVFCKLTDKHKSLKHNSEVLVKFSISSSNRALSEGQTFIADLNHIYPINLDAYKKKFKSSNLSEEEVLRSSILIPTIHTFIETLKMQEDNISQLESKKKNIDNLRDELSKKEVEIKQSETELFHQKNDVSEIISNIEEERNRLKVEWEHFFENRKKLEILGFYDKGTEKENNHKNIASSDNPKSINELVEKIQKELENRNLIYEKDTLKRVLLTLKTEQMLILCGPSGTGKTTLIKELAEIIDGELEIIPVQPSWTDKQDLFGYYNPIRKLYVPTAFLDCIISANNNPDRIHIICLDEINLAPIEYYLADFLSLNEVDSSKLRLYSDFEYHQNLSEIKWHTQKAVSLLDNLENNSEFNSSKDFEIIVRHENLVRYPATISIPKNIRIVGTMNVEGLVQPLSPKVIDRSFIVPMYRQSKKKSVVNNEISNLNLSINASYFTSTLFTPLPEVINESLLDIQNEVEKLNIEYNARFENHVLRYYNSNLDADMNFKQFLDDVVLLKVLPRIHEVISNKSFINNIEEVLEKYVGKDSQSMQKIEKMKQRYEQTSLYSYWS